MSLTMTRTRNQTTLDRLARMLAMLQGERDFVQDLLTGNGSSLSAAQRELLAGHLAKLGENVAAMRATLLQFDPELDVDTVRSLDTWGQRFGRRGLSIAATEKRLLEELTP